MATIKKNGLGLGQYGGFTPAGNVTTYRARLETDASGAVLDSSSSAPLQDGDVVVLAKLPAGYVMEDAQLICSAPMSTGVKLSMGFLYADGVDSAQAPQDAVYFRAVMAVDVLARHRASANRAPLRLAKEAHLVLSVSGSNTQASRIDVIVHGERMGDV